MNENTEYTYDIYLRDFETGKTGVYTQECSMTPDECLYYWEDGNASCDCNRSIWLYGYDSEDCLDCNADENIILVDKIVVRETGEELCMEE
jgi:hypothetical protein